MGSLLRTLLELGHSTSQNLSFAHLDGVHISFGEETITESNLLEIRRRHPKVVHIETFPKITESHFTGADWEWHIIGRKFTWRLRVQAKRVNKLGGIKGLLRRSKYAPKSQIELLIESAEQDDCHPIYCFYCTEQQRNYWKVGSIVGKRYDFETGCLIANAIDVLNSNPTKFSDIESKTVPWHFLCSNQRYSSYVEPSWGYSVEEQTYTQFEKVVARDYDDVGKVRFPTIDYLNGIDSSPFEVAGLEPTPLVRSRETEKYSYYGERGIRKLIIMEVTELDYLPSRRRI